MSEQITCEEVSAWGCRCRLENGHKGDHYGTCDYKHYWHQHLMHNEALSQPYYVVIEEAR